MLFLRLLDPLPNFEHLEIDGIPLLNIDRRVLRQRLIVVPQECALLPGQSSIKLNLDPLESATDQECLSVLEAVQLADFVENSGGLHVEISPDNLSAG